MTDHELQTWLNQIAENETHFWNYLDNAPSQDDTFGWGARLRHMWEKEPNRPCGLLLTGPNGCGKHTAAVHMFRILSEEYYVALVNGTALCDGGFASASGRLLGTIKHYGKENKPLCMILDGLEECGFRKDLFSFLGQILTVSWLRNVQIPPVFLILIDSYEEDIPAVLRSRLRLCRMALPTASRRRAYLKNNDFSMIHVAVNLDLLVDSTAGLTYAQLADLAQNLECTLHLLPKDQFSFTDEELLDFLQEQLPNPDLDDPLQSLAQSARQFIEHLPELLAHVGTAAVPAAVTQTTEVQTSQNQTSSSPPQELLPDKKDFKKEINDMPTIELCTDLFGKERLKQIRAAHQRA